jgi:hypothetical protein
VVGLEAVDKVLAQRLPPALLDLNRQALQMGYALGLA